MGWIKDKLGRTSATVTIDSGNGPEYLKVHEPTGVRIQINMAQHRLELEDGTPITNVAIGNVNRQVDSISTTSFGGSKQYIPGLERITFDCENIGPFDVVTQPDHSTRTDQPEPIEAQEAEPQEEPKTVLRGTKGIDPKGKYGKRRAS